MILKEDNEQKNIKILAIVGPTATGKSELAVMLADQINGEIISADSMQVYRQMNIATAKFKEKEQKGIKHHLIDCVNIDQHFSVVDYIKKAKDAVDQIIHKHKKPILVGGTGLYIDSLLNETQFTEKNSDDKIKIKLQDELDEFGQVYMYNKLSEVDPDYAKKVHPNNSRRVINALQIFYSTGKTLTSLEKITKLTPTNFESLKIGLSYSNRQNLYDKINNRVDLMLEKGLLDEAKYIFTYCQNFSSTAMQAIGYKEFEPYFKGYGSLDESISKLKQNTRKLAKRQLTWFKRDKSINWFYLDEVDKQEIFKKVLNLAQIFFS